MEKKISVDKSKCIHCGMCIKDCLVGCLEFDGEKIPRYTANGKENCIACQHCMAICPAGALSFGDKNPADSLAIDGFDSDEILRLIKSRRSIRKYKNQSIPADKLKKLIEMLAYPPTGVNINSLHFSIVGTKEKMQEIIKFTYEKISAAKNPSPFLKMAKDGYAAGQDVIYRGAPSMIAVAVNDSKVAKNCENADPIIALSYAELYAQSLDLGTLWCGMAFTVIQELPEVLALLEIPEGYSLNYVMLLGVPAVKYKRSVQREARPVVIV